jgi:hypothetical protein
LKVAELAEVVTDMVKLRGARGRGLMVAELAEVITDMAKLPGATPTFIQLSPMPPRDTADARVHH